MSRLATSFVLGYHGCEKDVGLRAINGETKILQSERAYDWLGPGAYFWESDPKRALEWALTKHSWGEYKDPFVIGAVIDLGNCLDLVSREDQEIVREAYASFCEERAKSKLELPENKPSSRGGDDGDRLLRFLDCAVIKHLHSIIDGADQPESYDTVRGMFTEGVELYPGAGFRAKSHVQIAVRNPTCIKGVFLPIPYPNSN